MKRMYILALSWFAVQMAEAQVEAPIDSGYYYYKAGNISQAIAHFTTAIEQQSDNAEAFYLRGVCKSQLGKNREAIKDYDQALAIDPHYPEVHFEKGYAYFLLNDFERAIACFDQAIRLNPKYTAALVNRGSVNCILGETAAAEEDWARAKNLGAQLPKIECE